jgi:Fe-S-cluster-containing hydrogenase component 2
MQKKEPGCSLKAALLFLEEFAGDELCGKCPPCRLGVMQAIELLKRMAEGAGERGDLDLLSLISVRMETSSMCKRGREVARRLHESLSKKRSEYEEHVQEKKCQALECDGLVTYRVIPERCNMCDACKKICEFDAIIGEPLIPYLTNNMPYQIRERRCKNCGRCLDVCPEGAIEVCQREGQQRLIA